MSKTAKDRAARMAKMRDADQEWRETKSPEALERRRKAALEGSPKDVARAGDYLAGQAWQEGEDRRTRLRELKFTGWRKK